MLGTLSVSHTGLNAARYAIDTIGNNQANENTPGYKKRVSELSEIGQVNGIMTGRGVLFDAVYRVTSQYLYDKLTSETSKLNYYEKVSALVGGVEMALKETDDTGISAEINRYYQAVENLRTNPNSEIYKSDLKRQGEVLVDNLQNIYKTIEAQQKDERKELNANVERINNILHDIASVNEKIQRYGTATNDLLDKRDLLELQLSEYVNISVDRDNDFYSLKIGDSTVISNNTNVQKVNLNDIKKEQVDKFNHIEYLTDNTFKIYDSLKYNDDYSSKGLAVGDTVTLKLNNTYDLSLTLGETVQADLGDGNGLQNITITEDNLTRVMVYKINSNVDLKGVVTAYNGDYAVDSNGNKITNNTQDNYLRIESALPGVENSFESRVAIEKAGATHRESIYKNEEESKEASSKVVFAIDEREINISFGTVKAELENLDSTSDKNSYKKVLDKLDSFAMTLSDVYDKFIIVGEDEYIYGEAGVDENLGEIKNIGLFSGTSVKTLVFNKNVVNGLKQEQLDYMASMQWNDNLTFDGKAQNPDSLNKAGLTDFFRDIRISVSAEKESNDYLKDTQEVIQTSIKTSYDNLVKVDKDDEMLNLMKFQAAFTANAQVITAINEMIQTILGMRR